MSELDTQKEMILVINAGSSSIKYKLFDAHSLDLLEDEKLEIRDSSEYEDVFLDIIGLLETYNITGIGHRVVHGGQNYSSPVSIDRAVLDELKELTPLAPLHQPNNLKPVELIMNAYPNMKQVACFDTAFHRTMPRLSEIYAIPAELTDEGIIKYGFHGSSYEYIASVLEEKAGADIAKGKVIIAHLGNGASMCALKDGKSVGTTMGFTPLDGLVMGTRSGSVDPGISLYLSKEKGMSTKSISEMFRKESGLKGVSGISSDMRELLSSDDPKAQQAVDLFCLQAAKQAASLTVELGGLDAIVFTAGIGENSPQIRQKICAHLEHLGVRVDKDANDQSKQDIHAVDSRVKVLTIPTNEGLMIAKHTKVLISNDQRGIALPEHTL